MKNIPGVIHLQSLARSRGWPYVASWAHRISGVLLVVYLLFHINTLAALTNPGEFDGKMKFFASFLPFYIEWFLAFPVIYHALNGGRIILYEVFGNRNENLILRWVMCLSVCYISVLGLFMIMGDQSVDPLFYWVHTVLASGFVTYWTVMKIRFSRTSFLWKLQRISGAFLFLMIPAHMLFMHLDPAIGRDAQVIIGRMNNTFIKLIDMILVVSVLYHSGYGLVGVCQDYIKSQVFQRACMALTVVVMMYFSWVGVRLVVLI